MALVAVSTPGFAKTLPASAGCDALNAGFFNYNDIPTLPGGPDTRTEVLVFTAGEKIGFSWQGIGGLTVQLNGANVISASSSSHGTESFEVAASGNATLFKRVVRGNHRGFVTVACRDEWCSTRSR